MKISTRTTLSVTVGVARTPCEIADEIEQREGRDARTRWWSENYPFFDIANIEIRDMYGNPTTEVYTGRQYNACAVIRNNRSMKLKAMVIVQVKSPDGVVYSLGSGVSEFNEYEEKTLCLMFVPAYGGRNRVEVYVWCSWEVPEPLTDWKYMEFDVV